jgi:hypothetical protein
MMKPHNTARVQESEADTAHRADVLAVVGDAVELPDLGSLAEYVTLLSRVDTPRHELSDGQLALAFRTIPKYHA